MSKRFNRLILIALVSAIGTFTSNGQDCSCISGTKDKKKGTETVGGVTNSKDFYSLLIHKQLNYLDTVVPPKYILTLNAASRFALSDSTLSTLGAFELTLLDNSTLTLDSVRYFNNPLKYCCSIGFQTKITEEQVKILSQNPIATLTVRDMLTTTFTSKKQQEQQIIFDCLLNRKQR